MEDAASMQIRDSVKHLFCNALDVLGLILELRMVQNARKIELQIVENHIHAPMGRNHFLQLQNIAMAEFLQ
jgi:hypothetical protein